MTPSEPGPRRRSQRRAFQADERERARQTFAEHTAEMIVSVAQVSNQGDPVAIAAHALAMAAGPDYDYDTELFSDAAADYDAIEEGLL